MEPKQTTVLNHPKQQKRGSNAVAKSTTLLLKRRCIKPLHVKAKRLLVKIAPKLKCPEQKGCYRHGNNAIVWYHVYGKAAWTTL